MIPSACYLIIQQHKYEDSIKTFFMTSHFQGFYEKSAIKSLKR